MNEEAKALKTENPANLGVAALAKKKEKLKATIKYQRDKDRQKVRGKFIFNEVPGGTMSFCFRKYKEDPVERFDLTDGMVYEIPLGVAKHLNQNLAYPIHQHFSSENGQHLMKVGTMVRRCAFQSLEFMDIDDMDDVHIPLATVEHVPQQIAI